MLHKAFWKNVCQASCKTDFTTFLRLTKGGSKAVAKLVNGFQPLYIFVKELHRKRSTGFFLKAPLIPSSNTIWHTYRLTADTRFSSLVYH